MKSRIHIFVTAGLFLILLANIAMGDIALNPRAVGMGGAYTALARNMEAPAWNPANLGLSDGRKLTVKFFSLGANIKNNSLTVSDYNRYSGKLLDKKDKDELINSIPSDGMSVDIGAEVTAVDLSIGNFAITQRVYGSSSVNVDKDPLKLMLLGNAVMREVHVTDTRGESYAFGDLAISYGQAIQRWPGGEISLGASLHYLKGLAYGRVIETQGGVITTDTGFVGSGYMKLRSAMGGGGYSSDIGMAMRFQESWYFSAGWRNLISKINWNKESEEYFTYFAMRPLTAEDFILEGQADSLVTSGDTSYSAPNFSSTLSPYLSIGLAKKNQRTTWSFDWQQAFFTGPGMNVNPRIAGGLEYLPWEVLPLRAGLAFGGGQGTLYSLGFGLYGGPYHFDLGIANSGSPTPANSKGLKLAIAMGLYF